jgi:Flp pilus assembly protein TadG
MSMRLFHDAHGTAAIEFAAAATLLVGLLANALDFNDYEYRSMQVADAAQVGAQTAWQMCNSASLLPATQNCSGLNAAITTAIQSTALGSRVSLSAGYPVEGYYCVNSSGALQSVGSLSSKPANCSAAGNANTSPGDYVQISVTASYAPLFPGLSVVGSWGVTSLSAISWMRLQ